MKLFYMLALMTILPATATGQLPTSVHTNLGNITGIRKNKKVFGQEMSLDLFHGIPYAEAPEGNLRFQRPVPKQTLTSDGSPFLATKHGNICLQRNFLYPMPGLTRSEDCLFLNIYAPSARTDPLPVMLFIHGGGYYAGASDQYVADTLALYGNVIVVTINYRLSAWGFLSTGDEHAPGNLGLWDQHTAIKWVHDNINAFGGDPDNVTIFGESAGGYSVTFQALHDGNKGLFRRAIAMSGNLHSPSTYHPKEDAKRLGRIVGCVQTDSKKLVQCLQSLPVERLDVVINNFTSGLYSTPFPPFLPSKDPFMFHNDTKSLLLFDQRGREVFGGVDFMAGVCAVEPGAGAMLSPLVMREYSESFQPNRTFLKHYIPKVLPTKEETPEVLTGIIAHEYTDWSDPDNMEKRISKVLQILQDKWLTAPTEFELSEHSKIAQDSISTYMYMFGIIPPRNIYTTPSWFHNATHGDILLYLFYDEDSPLYLNLPGPAPTDRQLEDWERDAAKYVMDLFTNFAKTGNPNEPKQVSSQTWPTYSHENRQYFKILRNQSADAVGKDLISRYGMFLWDYIVPTMLDDAQKAQTTHDCEANDGFAVHGTVAIIAICSYLSIA